MEAHCYSAAKQPLRATLRFQLDTNPFSSETCLGPEPGCTFLHQNCYTFCSTGAHATGTWVVFAPVLPLWTFTTPSGRALERDIPDNSLYDYWTGQTADESLLAFSISWDRLGWHVVIPTSTNSQVSGLPYPACAFVLDAAQPFMSSVNFNGDNISLNWQFASGGLPAAGCVGVGCQFQPAAITPTPTSTQAVLAYCLHRFGVLLTVNDSAHRLWPNLPLADAYEQRLAQQLAASLDSVQP